MHDGADMNPARNTMAAPGTRPRRRRRTRAAHGDATPARRRRRVALLLVGAALAIAGCAEPSCRSLAVRICEACRDKASARAGTDTAPREAAAPAAMDMPACIERTVAACEAHRGPPGCPT